ncbi:MAG TPA: peptidoglycan-binding domain-containing protein, partial [Conexibacter sp.]|nr:peptidoglycan-binding domain-containing protein [Conexibacter sp.]
MLRRGLVSSVALVVLLSLLPASAIAARAAPSFPRATGRIGVNVVGSWPVNGRQLAVTGRPLQLEGRIVPYVAGETVSVRIWRGHTLLKAVSVRPKPTRTGKTATFSVRFQPEKAGDVQVFALHERTDAQRRLLAKAPLSIVTPSAGPGTRSPFVALLQQRLAALGYATPQTGVYDSLTGLAVLAFRKVNGMPRI